MKSLRVVAFVDTVVRVLLLVAEFRRFEMKGIVIDGAGGPEVLKLRDMEDPALGEGEVMVKVAATAVNRADTVQRKGSYPVPKGASLIPGLECSGTIEAVGHGVTNWKVGDQVCGADDLFFFVRL